MPLYQERSFRNGLDQINEPNRIRPGFVQVADNILTLGDSLISRPGIQAQLAVAMGGGAAIFEPTSYLRSDGGAPEILFVSGGNLWRWSTSSGATLPTEIKKGGGVSFAFANGGAAVRLVRFGKYLYGCDGVGPLFRVNLEGGIAEAYSGLTTPGTGPSAILGSQTLDALNNASEASLWSTDQLTSQSGGSSFPPSATWSANIFPNGNFSSVIVYEPAGGGAFTQYNGSSPTTGGFDFFGKDVDFHQRATVPVPATFTGTTIWCELDDPGEGFVTDSFIANGTYTTEGDSCNRLIVAYNYYSGDTSGKSGIVVEVTAFDSGHNQLGGAKSVTRTFPYIPAATGSAVQYNVFDFADIAPFGSTTQITYWKVRITGGPGNKVGTTPVIANVSQYLTGGDWTIGTAGASGGIVLSHSELASDLWGKIAGTRVVKDYTSTQDWSGFDTIAFVVSGGQITTSGAGNLLTGGLTWRVGFRANGGTTTALSNPVTFGTVAGVTYAIVDVSSLSATARQFRYLELWFDGDVTGLTQALSFTISSIRLSGNLAIGRSYTWLFSEVLDPYQSGPIPAAPPADVIESSGSPLSNGLVPTNEQAIGVITLPTPRTNAAAQWLNIWRGGGTFEDGFWRLVASVPVGADAAGDGWSWNHTTRTFTDDVPDSDLLLADIYEINRDPFPSGVSCLAIAHGRLYAAAGATIYVSWLLTANNEAGLYTSLSTDPTDPELLLKGATFTLGSGNEGDPILAIVPLATGSAVLRTNCISLLNGFDPTNFAALDQYRSAGIGIIAPRSAIIDPHVFSYGFAPDSGVASNPNGFQVKDPMATFLSQSGVIGYNMDTPRPLSEMIERLLNPNAAYGTGSADALDAAAYANATQVYHDRRRFLFAPKTTSDSVNNCAYVWDSRTNAWTRWTWDALGMGVTGACSIRTDLYLAGTDGQLYKLTGSVDRQATAPGNGLPIPVSLVTRKWGQDPQENEAYWYANRVERCYAELVTAERLTFVISVFAEDSPASPYTKSWLTNSTTGHTALSFKAGEGLHGIAHWLGFSCQVTQPLRLQSLALFSAESRRL